MSHPCYNRDNYPIFVQHSGPWDIYRDESGRCASIPAKAGNGHKASHFGDMRHVERINRETINRGQIMSNARYFEACMMQSVEWLQASMANPTQYMKGRHLVLIRKAILNKLPCGKEVQS